jgi:hypothetical protein
MPTTGPTRALIKVQREAAEYREYMTGVYMRKGMNEKQARECAAVATDTQLAIRMQELEQLRLKRMKEQGKLPK